MLLGKTTKEILTKALKYFLLTTQSTMRRPMQDVLVKSLFLLSHKNIYFVLKGKNLTTRKHQIETLEQKICRHCGCKGDKFF